MPPEIRAVTGGENLSPRLYLMILLAWPDINYVERLIYGFPIVGEIDAPPIFRPTARVQEALSEHQLLSTADARVSELLASARISRDPAEDNALLEQTSKDFGVFSSFPMTREDLDVKYGKGVGSP